MKPRNPERGTFLGRKRHRAGGEVTAPVESPPDRTTRFGHAIAKFYNQTILRKCRTTKKDKLPLILDQDRPGSISPNSLARTAIAEADRERIATNDFAMKARKEEREEGGRVYARNGIVLRRSTGGDEEREEVVEKWIEDACLCGSPKEEEDGLFFDAEEETDEEILAAAAGIPLPQRRKTCALPLGPEGAETTGLEEKMRKALIEPTSPEELDSLDARCAEGAETVAGRFQEMSVLLGIHLAAQRGVRPFTRVEDDRRDSMNFRN